MNIAPIAQGTADVNINRQCSCNLMIKLVEATCPHCGYIVRFDEWYDFEDDESSECPKCGKTMYVLDVGAVMYVCPADSATPGVILHYNAEIIRCNKQRSNIPDQRQAKQVRCDGLLYGSVDTE